MDIECCLTNINGSIYKNIMFRKFFQILFFYEDMKRIDVYTATVFGGSKQKSDEINYLNFYSTIDEDFKIKFEFNIKNINPEKFSITHEECTDNFLKQVDKTKIIWGNGSECISTQSDIEKKLKNILDTYRHNDNCLNNENCEKCEKKSECKDNEMCLKHKECNICKNFKLRQIESTKTKAQKYLYVSDDKEKEISLAVMGSSEINKDDNSFIIKGEKDLHNGVEVLNWMHTTIQFKEVQHFNLFKYIISFSDGNKIWAPDFTLYIGPPEGYIINLNSSMVKLGDNDHLRDVFQEVGTYKELYYDEWINHCNIMNKKMHRVLKDKLFHSDNKEIGAQRIELSVNFKDEVGKEKFQFVFGIVISTILAFGIDYTRMGDIKNCFIPATFLPDTQWIITCVLILLVITRGWSRKESAKSAKSAKSDKKHKIPTIIGGTGLICLSLWFIATFIMYQGYIHSYFPWAQLGSFVINKFPFYNTVYYILLGLGWILCLAYIILSNTIFKDDYVSKKVTRKMRL